uniref:Putative secreted protein n=1 Tax=Anopheles darlingi TaxID=43151 RepID=A0A2M4D7K3_ANODA
MNALIMILILFFAVAAFLPFVIVRKNFRLFHQVQCLFFATKSAIFQSISRFIFALPSIQSTKIFKSCRDCR